MARALRVIRRHSCDSAQEAWNRTPAEIEREVCDLARDGRRTSTISIQLGLPIRTINDIRRRNGISAKKGRTKTNFRVRQKRVLITLSDEQQGLAEEWMSYARALALKFFRTTAGQVDADELIAQANLGLCMAARLYQPGAVPFKSMCVKFIKGQLFRAMSAEMRARGYGYTCWQDRVKGKPMVQIVTRVLDIETYRATRLDY